MKIESVKGTRDFYPEQKFIQDHIFKTWENVAKKYGYEDFDGPMLEPADLWRMKSGAEIPEQMYVFKDKGDREVAIRPELTPTVARMIAAKQKSLTKPIKWWSNARCWRYEQPQSGRLREFFQLNIDCLGSDSMQLDAEVIATAISIMKEFGLSDDDFYIRIGNRKLIEDLILSSGIKKTELKNVSRLIDKLEKIGKDNFAASLKVIEIKDDVIKKLLDLLENNDLKKIDGKKLSEDGIEGLEKLKELFLYLSYYGFSKYVEFDPTIMRGFDYYTSTVFEVFDRHKKHRAIAGGGRYDNLVEDFGGEPLSGVGYGMGDVVLEAFLRDNNKLPEYKKDIDFFVAVLNDECSSFAIKIAAILRKKHTVELELLGRNLAKQFKYADKIGAKFVAIVGEDEVKKHTVKIKDLSSGVEKEVKLSDFEKV